MQSIVVGRGEREHDFLLFDSQEDFEQHFGDDQPIVVHWRKAENRFDWIVTDEGGITQAIDVKWYGKSKKEKYVTTVCGTVVDAGYSVLTNNMRRDRKDMWRIGSIYNKPSNPKTIENRLLRKKVKWLILFIIAGVRPEKAFDLVYSEDAKKLNPLNSDKRREELMSRIVSSRWGKKRMSTAIKEAAANVGLSHEYIMKQYMKVVEKEGVSDTHILQAIGKLSEIMETVPKEAPVAGLIGGGMIMGGEIPGHLPPAQDPEQQDAFLIGEDELARPDQ